MAPGLPDGRERDRPPAGIFERLAREPPDLIGVGRVRVRLDGIQIVTREHFRDLGRLLAPGFAKVAGRREMTGLAVTARERAERDRVQQRLQEDILAPLRREGVVDVAEDLLGDE